MDILKKISQANLIGRGGGCFSTALKWEMVKKAKGRDKYVICNASEGEPGIKKDFYLLEKRPKEVINGIKIAIDFLSAKEAYIYLNPDYFVKLNTQLKKTVQKLPILIFKKPHQAGYIGGEETSIINSIEGKRIEPRLRPPFPPTNGLENLPTLVNNVETFYNVNLVAKNKFKHTRLYTINGDCLWTGVYEFNENWTIEKILIETKNYPKFNFFVQVGGDASGEVLNSRQLKRSAIGSGSITVYSINKHQPMDLIRKWINFFADESCGQCVPCREGTYRLKELINEKSPNWEMISDIFNSLQETSFCGLGCAVPIAVRSYISNVLPLVPENKIILPASAKKIICDCFK